MTETSAAQAPKKPTARARITNGRQLLPHVDGRSVWARRLRDVLDAHVADKGGPEGVSEAELSILRRAATLTVELEHLESRFASARSGGRDVDAGELDLYSRLAGNLRRLLESVGLERRTRDVPHPRDYLEQRVREREQ